MSITVGTRVQYGSDTADTGTVVETRQSLKRHGRVGGQGGGQVTGNVLVDQYRVDWDGTVSGSDENWYRAEELTVAATKGHTMTTVSMGPEDTNYKGDNWYRKYRTTGGVQFTELQVSRADVRKGDLMRGEIEYDGWAHVDRVATTANRHPWTGEVSPARTRISFGGMSWTSQLATDVVTVRRPI